MEFTILFRGENKQTTLKVLKKNLKIYGVIHCNVMCVTPMRIWNNASNLCELIQFILILFPEAQGPCAQQGNGYVIWHFIRVPPNSAFPRGIPCFAAGSCSTFCFLSSDLPLTSSPFPVGRRYLDYKACSLYSSMESGSRGLESGHLSAASGQEQSQAYWIACWASKGAEQLRDLGKGSWNWLQSPASLALMRKEV